VRPAASLPGRCSPGGWRCGLHPQTCCSLADCSGGVLSSTCLSLAEETTPRFKERLVSVLVHMSITGEKTQPEVRLDMECARAVTFSDVRHRSQ